MNDTAAALNPNLGQAQREALSELTRLAGEDAAAETRFEHQAFAEQESADTRLARFTGRLASRREAHRDKLAAAAEAQRGAVHAAFDADAESLQGVREAALADAVRAEDAETAAVRADYDRVVGQVNAIFESAERKIEKRQRSNHARIGRQRGTLDEARDEAAKVLRRFRLKRILKMNLDHPEATVTGPVKEVFEYQRAEAGAALRSLKRLILPRLVSGYVKPLIITVVCCVASAYVILTQTDAQSVKDPKTAIALSVTFGVVVVIVVCLKLMAYTMSRGWYIVIHDALALARDALEQIAGQAAEKLTVRRAEAEHIRQSRVQDIRTEFEPKLAEIAQRVEAIRQRVNSEHDVHLTERERARDAELQADDDAEKRVIDDLNHRYDRLESLGRARHESTCEQLRNRRTAEHERIRQRWAAQRDFIDAALQAARHVRTDTFPDWGDAVWNDWTPPRQYTPAVMFGEAHVDMRQITADVHPGGCVEALLPPPFDTPALLAFPDRASLLVQPGPDGREAGVDLLQTVMMRLLTSVPPGRVRFTMIDPIGLGQSFAGFMHLADHDDALVGGRIWTEAGHIYEQLADLTEHMENVIQKYLRNEYETIDEYNTQAGELVEPYRYLVAAGYPNGFSEDATRRLSSIAASGAKCGVYTLIAVDPRGEMPRGVTLEDLHASSVVLHRKDNRWVWKDDLFERFPLTVDHPPSEQMVTRIANVVGGAAVAAGDVKLPFSVIAPTPEQRWSRRSDQDLVVPIGRSGATRVQSISLGRGVAQHALIAGKTGSGKSTLLHALITNLALWYPPDQVEFYLVDFKKGVEFRTYAEHGLPHARAIAIESDREFGLSVLQKLDAEMTRRGDLYRKLGVQDLAGYRAAAPDDVMPRSLLIIDEFQEFFSEEDKIAQDAALLLDRLVRQGRAFGIHVLLGSQTLGGAGGLARTTMGQMAVRIALQCSEADSQLILSDTNSAARLLSRPGEAIYNDQGGAVEGNSPFQISWLPEEEREQLLAGAGDLAEQRGERRDRAIVFEGNCPADIEKNLELDELLRAPRWPGRAADANLWLGEPVAIKAPTRINLRRQSGANVLIVGQHEEGAMATLCAAMIGIAAQRDPSAARFVIFDGCPADSPLAGNLQRVAGNLPHETRLIEYRAVPEAMTELVNEARRRQESDDHDAPATYVLIYGLQRYRALRRSEDDYGFSTDDDKPPAPDKLFAELLREGPAVGMHTVAWCDTAIALDRTLDRNAMREFDHRVLFQMSAADSSNLIDAPAANKLGFYRALSFSEEQGVMEKFRPYALSNGVWLDEVAALLGKKAAAT